MISLSNRGIIFFLKLYVAVALIIAAVLSPLALSFIPILLLAWYLYLWRWPITPVVGLLTVYFMFFAVTLLFTTHVGPYLTLVISLPVLILVHHSLEETAESLDYLATRYARRPTNICLTIFLIAIIVLGISLLLGSLALLLACAVIFSYSIVLGALILRRLPLKPVEETQVQQRMVAGTEAQLYIRLATRTKVGGLLFLESPYPWLKLSPGVLSLEQSDSAVKVTLSPMLAGPSIVKLRGKAIDRWGLIQVSFELEPIRLYVIPRAKYADWLARRYMAGTRLGTLPLISNLEAIRPIYGLRRGVEYYGSQLYQPGDSLKSIDWKHSLKYNELITKEFAEFHGQPAVILINLAVGNAEEADKLAYNIIVTAISLARENIPAALAAYDHEGVKVTTSTLQPQQLVVQSHRIAQEMVTFINPVKFLDPPDVVRLRANMSRLRYTESEAAGVLSRLMQMEYKSLSHTASLHPATKAVREALIKADKQSNIVIISQRNHDAEALAFNTFNLIRRGNAVISV